MNSVVAAIDLTRIKKSRVMKAYNRIGGIEEINVPDREAAVWTKAKSKERKPRLGGYSGLDKVTGNHNISSKNDK